MKTNKTKALKIFGWIALGIQTVVSAVSIYALYALKMIPTQYVIGAISIVVILLIGMGVWIIRGKGFTSRILSLLITVAIIFGSMAALDTARATGTVSGANKDVHTMNVIVLKDDPATSITDIKNEKFGVNEILDKKTVPPVLKVIKEKEGFDVTVEGYMTNDAMLRDLYEGKTRVIMVSGGQFQLINEIDSEFEGKIKVVATYEFEEEVSQDDTNNKGKPNVLKDTYTIFLSGIDTYGSVATVSRSDVNMLITVNPTTNQVLLTSIPRDYFVTLASFGQKDKLTHAGIYGVNESMSTLENLFDIDIDYYIRVNFNSVTSIVDAMGGVDVYTKYTFTTSGGKYNFYEGENHVNGDAALSFVRERYNLPNGDNDRVYHQQQLIQAILRKAMSPAIITSYSSLLNSISGAIQMSFSENELNSIIRNQIETMAPWEFLQYQVSGTGETRNDTYSMPGWNLYVMIPNEDTVNTASSYIKAMVNGETISVGGN